MVHAETVIVRIVVCRRPDVAGAIRYNKWLRNEGGVQLARSEAVVCTPYLATDNMRRNMLCNVQRLRMKGYLSNTFPIMLIVNQFVWFI